MGLIASSPRKHKLVVMERQTSEQHGGGLQCIAGTAGATICRRARAGPVVRSKLVVNRKDSAMKPCPQDPRAYRKKVQVGRVSQSHWQ